MKMPYSLVSADYILSDSNAEIKKTNNPQSVTIDGHVFFIYRVISLSSLRIRKVRLTDYAVIADVEFTTLTGFLSTSYNNGAFALIKRANNLLVPVIYNIVGPNYTFAFMQLDTDLTEITPFQNVAVFPSGAVFSVLFQPSSDSDYLFHFTTQNTGAGSTREIRTGYVPEPAFIPVFSTVYSVPVATSINAIYTFAENNVDGRTIFYATPSVAPYNLQAMNVADTLFPISINNVILPAQPTNFYYKSVAQNNGSIWTAGFASDGIDSLTFLLNTSLGDTMGLQVNTPLTFVAGDPIDLAGFSFQDFDINSTEIVMTGLNALFEVKAKVFLQSDLSLAEEFEVFPVSFLPPFFNIVETYETTEAKFISVITPSIAPATGFNSFLLALYSEAIDTGPTSRVITTSVIISQECQPCAPILISERKKWDMGT